MTEFHSLAKHCFYRNNFYIAVCCAQSGKWSGRDTTRCCLILVSLHAWI